MADKPELIAYRVTGVVRGVEVNSVVWTRNQAEAIDVVAKTRFDKLTSGMSAAEKTAAGSHKDLIIGLLVTVEPDPWGTKKEVPEEEAQTEAIEDDEIGPDDFV